ncbi:phosphoglycerate kinase [Leptolyngbya sp. 7M]|uniref:phosphoglycerate kinase n=1 Tax=Leptolyngbya sp. 7M TaxID=2812896 RepID=UPI001B8B81DF|nr:phosphoglycerate kinase [Leptolyngbya sp. 7M]QYO66961.1 phosphoglycerate kinase [Leptolyngbya sp. 7M]
MNKKSIKDISLEGKTVFIRVDFNVPLKDGVVEDDTRIRGAIPTIEYAIEQGAKVVLASHLGRPLKDKKKTEEKGIEFDPSKYTLRPVAEKLSELIGKDVAFEKGDVLAQIGSLASGNILMRENLRLNAGEEKNDPEFAKQLSKGIDIYVNDAFGTAHRAHASTEGITHYVDTSVAGLLMEKELRFLGKALNNPERPFVAILGGAKVSDKIPVIEALIERKVNKLLIGGAMAYTFFKANGYTVGKSLVEDEMMPTALEVVKKAEAAGVELLLPTDHIVVDSFDPINSQKAIQIEFTNAGHVGLDIGPETAGVFANALEGAQTIVWNGPMGMFEEKPFDQGTFAIANAVAEATDKGAVSIVGGGDSVAAINQAGLADRISHISTGGGATLEFLAGEVLPGVAALEDR